ncbi:MAG TPA: CBS domain-containing protein [Alphaproteobacteria bacterium]
MQIKNVMTQNPTWLSPTTTIQEAAQKMQQLDCGFIPVGENDKLTGVITDRDIACRAVAQGKNANTPVSEILSNKVLYCYETDTVDTVAKNMQEQQVRRLVVLNNQNDKKLVGIVSVCDLVQKAQDNTNSQLIKGVSQCDTANKTKAA